MGYGVRLIVCVVIRCPVHTSHCNLDKREHDGGSVAGRGPMVGRADGVELLCGLQHVAGVVRADCYLLSGSCLAACAEP